MRHRSQGSGLRWKKIQMHSGTDGFAFCPADKGCIDVWFNIVHLVFCVCEYFCHFSLPLSFVFHDITRGFNYFLVPHLSSVFFCLKLLRCGTLLFPSWGGRWEDKNLHCWAIWWGWTQPSTVTILKIKTTDLVDSAASSAGGSWIFLISRTSTQVKQNVILRTIIAAPIYRYQ